MVRFQNSDRLALVLATLGGAVAALGTLAGPEWIAVGALLMLAGGALFPVEGFKKGQNKKP